MLKKIRFDLKQFFLFHLINIIQVIVFFILNTTRLTTKLVLINDLSNKQINKFIKSRHLIVNNKNYMYLIF